MSLTEILPSIHQLPNPDKIKLIRILAEDLDHENPIEPFEVNKTYYLPTPYDSFGAAEILMKELAKASQENI
jgi:hypothetical protein